MKWFFKLLALGSSYRSTDMKYIGTRLVRIKSINMIGPFEKSPDEKYVLVLKDSDKKGGRGGNRLSGKGRFALVRDGKVLYTGQCERPTNGVVSNSGSFAIGDTLFSDKVGAKLYVYTPNGELTFSHKFSANIKSMGISDNGQYVIIQLYNSDTEDSAKSILFDTSNKRIISRFDPISFGNVKHYEFFMNEGFIQFCYSSGRKYLYTFDGTFLDYERYDKERIEDASATDLVMIVREKMQSPSPEKLPVLLELIERAFSMGLKGFHDYSPTAFRLKGEILEAMNNRTEAISSYKKALELNPKIGVKRKLQQLEKETG